MNDITRTWHHVHTTDANAKPMLGPFSGISIIVLLASLILAMGLFFILSEYLALGFFPVLALSSLPPLFTVSILITLIGKPQNYALRWLECQHIKHNELPLLTDLTNHDYQEKH